MSSEPSERSMERARDIYDDALRGGTDESIHARIPRLYAAALDEALDEAREEGRREGVKWAYEDAARLCGSDQLRSAVMRGEIWDAARYACRDAIRARSNPSKPAEGGS